ncbi:MAG: hypothetical protein WEB30_04675 [Cyclobacteriaceae bacterium]
MKIRHILTAISLLALVATASPAVAAPIPESNIPESREAYATELKNRLEEIRAIDKTDLGSAEKKALRREVRAIKKELAVVGGGVFLSVGAILLIALLLILLL